MKDDDNDILEEFRASLLPGGVNSPEARKRRILAMHDPLRQRWLSEIPLRQPRVSNLHLLAENPLPEETPVKPIDSYTLAELIEMAKSGDQRAADALRKAARGLPKKPKRTLTRRKR